MTDNIQAYVKKSYFEMLSANIVKLFVERYDAISGVFYLNSDYFPAGIFKILGYHDYEGVDHNLFTRLLFIIAFDDDQQKKQSKEMAKALLLFMDITELKINNVTPSAITFIHVDLY